MSVMKLTLIGQERFLKNLNLSLFDDLDLPEGINRETLINTLLMDCGEFEVLYSDPYFMRDMVSIWGDKHKETFTKWAEALAIEYNPLENYDRIEDGRDSFDNNGDGTSKVAAYDTDSFSDRTHDDSHSEGWSKHDLRIHGNIGVTTSQQMLESELKLREWNIYQHIIDLFKDDFCILVY